jgi:hypothetical protein
VNCSSAIAFDNRRGHACPNRGQKVARIDAMAKSFHAQEAGFLKFAGSCR